MRILVRAPNWVGDQILAFPFFHFLRVAHPRARIAAVCVPWVASIQYRDLVDEVFTLPRPASTSLPDRFRAIEAATRELRANGVWDLGICLPDSLSSAWTMYRSGCTVRRGYVGDGRSFLLTERLRPSVQHRAQAYLDLMPRPPNLDVLKFWGVPPENDLDPALPGVLPEFDAARAWPGEPLSPPAERYWVVAPGSLAESRRWPAERFASLARLVRAETGLRGLIVGGPADRPLAAELARDPSTGLEDWTGRGAVAALWKVFRHAAFTVSNDSGLAHVASLCGSPTQIVWGAGDPKQTEPLGPGRARVLFNPVDCWPCVRNTCSQMPERYLDCLRGIEPQSVWKEIQSGLRPRLAQAAHP